MMRIVISVDNDANYDDEDCDDNYNDDITKQSS
jgi:hypothetical protein